MKTQAQANDLTDPTPIPSSANGVDPCLPIAEVSARLEVNVDTLRRWCKAGTIPSEKSQAGSKIRYFVRESDVKTFLNRDGSNVSVSHAKPTAESSPAQTSTVSPAVKPPAAESTPAVTAQPTPPTQPAAQSSPIPYPQRRVPSLMHIKNSMRKLSMVQLLDMNRWILGRLEREFTSKREPVQ